MTAPTPDSQHSAGPAGFVNPRLNDLAALKPGWDSYDANRISTAALNVADHIDIGPLPSGGLTVTITDRGGSQMTVEIARSGDIAETLWVRRD